jgi:hypothetical protein
MPSFWNELKKNKCADEFCREEELLNMESSADTKKHRYYDDDIPADYVQSNWSPCALFLAWRLPTRQFDVYRIQHRR